MAKEYHYCEGCSAETVVYATNRAEAQRKLKWWQETKPLCGKCEAKKDFVAAVERANELELVDLVGTEAQVEWAQRIRVPIIVELMEVSERGGAYVKYKEDVLAHLCTISSAAWWIEDGRSYDLVDRVHRQLKAAAQPKNDPVIMGTVELEATLRPETPVTETIATLRKVTDTLVIVRFDEKREDFREAIKAFGFKWNDVQKKWDLMCNPDQSSAITIEVGAHLLGCGFPVRILDTEIREAIRAGDVAKSDGRQIDYAGKDHFRVDWRRIDGDYYDEVRKIPLSKWDKENQTVLVPIGAADDLRDFASRFGFPMTERATAAAAAFDEYRRSGMVDGKKRKKGEVVEVLDRTAFPDTIKIDQSLLD